MIYKTGKDWQNARDKRVLLFGMSGLGKTHISNLLRAAGNWFHYSVDYRIGTRYMGEHIADNFKREAMKVPLLRELLMTDSVHISSNITFNNLAPLSTYLGKPGDPARGGVPFDEYLRRQEQHRVAEIAALMDTPTFIHRAAELYGYANFVCDSGGSICEVVNPDNRDDPVLKVLEDNLLLIWICGSDAHRDELIRRFRKSPKPMYYRPQFLVDKWAEFKALNGVTDDAKVDPDAFGAWGFEALLYDRLPRYQKLADQHGYTIDATDLATVRDGEEFIDLVTAAIKARMR